MKDIILGGDFGTNGLKLLAYDMGGDREIASSYQPYVVHAPGVNWAEHDPADYWTAFKNAVAELTAKGVYPDSVRAVALSSHVPTAIPVDRDGEALYPAMIWADGRTERQAKFLKEQFGEEIAKVNPAAIFPYFHICKLLWIRDELPEIYRKAVTFLQCNSYVNYLLTGAAAMDYSSAISCHLYNVYELKWDDGLCGLIGIDREKLPKVVKCDEVLGTITPAAAAECGLRENTLVIAGGADSSVAPLGVGCVNDGDVCYSMGTGASLVVVRDCEKRGYATRDDIITLGHPLGYKVCNIGVTGNNGGSLQWMRNVLGQEERNVASLLKKDPYEILCAEAEQSRPAAGGLLYFPYTHGELTPFFNNDARGAFFGLSDDTTKGDMVRAVIEATAYTTRLLLGIMKEMGDFSEEIISTGGPAKNPFWMQTMADITGARLAILDSSLGAPFGDVILAASGAGIVKDAGTYAREHINIQRVYEPQDTYREIYDDAYSMFVRMSYAMQDDCRELADIRRKL